MALPEEEIKKLIKESIPDASIEIKDLMGDNNHYAAIIKSSKFNNIYYENIGLTQKDYFEIESELKINVKDLYKANNEWYSNY